MTRLAAINFYLIAQEHLVRDPHATLRAACAQAADELRLDDANAALLRPITRRTGDLVGAPALAFVREMLSALQLDTLPAPPPRDTVPCPMAWEVAS